MNRNLESHLNCLAKIKGYDPAHEMEVVLNGGGIEALLPPPVQSIKTNGGLPIKVTASDFREMSA